MNATVRNEGSSSASATTLRYYRSADSAISSSDTEVIWNWVNGLAASESRAYEVELTAPSAAGTYYYGACAGSVPAETDTTDNCSASVTVTVSTAPAPDLVVDTPTVSESSPTTGASFTLNATARNSGDASSGSTTLRYFRSTDSTITGSDTAVGTDSVSGLSASGTSSESITLTAPSTTGTYYYGACVDSVTGESDTTNNCSAAVTVTVSTPTTAPDLALRSIAVRYDSTASPIAGTSFRLVAQVHNIGRAASTATTLRYYRSDDSTITASDSEVGTDSVIALPWGRGLLAVSNITVTAPDNPGTYYYGACVDSVPNESDTSNNCSTAVEITVLPPPDLVVDSLWIDRRAASTVTLSHGQSFELSAVVRNQGNDLLYSTTVHFFLSIDATITTSDTEVGTRGRAFSGSRARVTLTAPNTSGTYYYGACADPVSLESDTTNNCSGSIQAIVRPPPAPDLVVDTPTVSDSSLTAGRSFTLSFTVRNQGNLPSGPITLRYYRSDDAEFDDDDTLVVTQKTDTVVLSDGERSFTSERITAHMFFAPDGDGGSFKHGYISIGTYYYIVCVDQGEGESDTTNNCSTGIAVTATSPTSFRHCIVGYVLTPLDKCLHRGTLVAYGEIDAFNSGLGLIYFYSDTKTRLNYKKRKWQRS